MINTTDRCAADQIAAAVQALQDERDEMRRLLKQIAWGHRITYSDGHAGLTVPGFVMEWIYEASGVEPRPDENQLTAA